MRLCKENLIQSEFVLVKIIQRIITKSQINLQFLIASPYRMTYLKGSRCH